MRLVLIENDQILRQGTNAVLPDFLFVLDTQVSLDSRVREAINRNMQEPTSHTFDDAQLQIYTLMQRDSYPRYMNSQAYKNLLNSLPEQSPESKGGDDL